ARARRARGRGAGQARRRDRSLGAGVERRRAAQLVAYADALLPTHDTASRSELALLAGGLALIGGRGGHRALLDRAIDGAGLREPDLLAAMLETRARLHGRD